MKIRTEDTPIVHVRIQERFYGTEGKKGVKKVGKTKGITIYDSTVDEVYSVIVKALKAAE